MGARSLDAELNVLGARNGGSERTFRATSTACVLLTRPTTADPCLSASRAYSTWKMRPWGELGELDQLAKKLVREVENLQGYRVIVVVVSEHCKDLNARA